MLQSGEFFAGACLKVGSGLDEQENRKFFQKYRYTININLYTSNKNKKCVLFSGEGGVRPTLNEIGTTSLGALEDKKVPRYR